MVVTPGETPVTTPPPDTLATTTDADDHVPPTGLPESVTVPPGHKPVGPPAVIVAAPEESTVTTVETEQPVASV